MQTQQDQEQNTQTPSVEITIPQQFSNDNNLNSDSYSYSSLQSLCRLPVGLSSLQCVWFNRHELLICGGYKNGHCFSYHTLKDQYKLICEYPISMASTLVGHAVIRWDIDDDNDNDNDNDNDGDNTSNDENSNNNNNNNNKKKSKQMTLLSFGGQFRNHTKHTLVMKYQSVWEWEDEEDFKNMIEKYPNQNKWVAYPHINIGKKEDDLWYVHAIVGKKYKNRNRYIYILYNCKILEVLDFKSLDVIFQKELPFSVYHTTCFRAIPSKGYYDQMVLFYGSNALLIRYDDDDEDDDDDGNGDGDEDKESKLQYEYLSIYHDIKDIHSYSYVGYNHSILFFSCSKYIPKSKRYLYSIKNKEWNVCPPIELSSTLYTSYITMEPNQKWVHIIGGKTDQIDITQHLRIKRHELIGLNEEDVEIIVGYWIRHEKGLRMGWIIEFDKIISNYI